MKTIISRNPLTDEQLEQAARRVCELEGSDPDELVVYNDGTGHAVLRRRPYWMNVADVIHTHDLMEIAITEMRQQQ